MKAVVFEQFGGLDRVAFREIERPEPAAHEVQIEVHHAAVNPVDWKLGAGFLRHLWPHHFPMIIGWDAAGLISAIGDQVTNFAVGDPVYAFCRKPEVQWGTYAEYVCMTAEDVAPKPEALTFAEAASLPLVGLTAWQAYFDVAKIQKGQRILVHAGAGGVGSIAIQLAKHAGAQVYTTARLSNHAYVRALGADCCIDYTTSSFVERVRELAPEGVDMVFDCVGGETLQQSYQLVRPKGWLVTIAGKPDEVLAEEHKIRVKPVMVRPNGQQLRELASLFDQGILHIPELTSMPLDDAVKALEQIKTEHTRGKIVLAVKEE